MNNITFTKNWNNKLHCSVFTTIRRYKVEIGKEVLVTCKTEKDLSFIAICIDCIAVAYRDLLKKKYIIFQDTGVDSVEAFDKIVKAMYKDLTDDTVFYVILLKKKKGQ